MLDRTSLPLSWPEGRVKSYRISSWIALPLIAFVSFRKLVTTFGYPQFPAVPILLGAFTLLFFTRPALSRRFGWYRPLYFLLQMVLLEALGLVYPYEDTWGLLYIILAMQLRDLPSPRSAAAFAAAFTAALLVTMMSTLGLLQGLGFSLLIVALSLLFFSYDLLFSKTEAAKQESQELLDELQTAHRRLKEYAARADELAATEERVRLVRELHDSVGQMIFSISLTAEAARMLLEKDPARVPAALDQLQELTGRALAQMRSLISQWRPG
jgi:signal transduction histidine kinase